jgi:hypothetical protein
MPHLMRGLGDRLSSLQLDAQSYAGTAVRLALPAAIGWSVADAAFEQQRFVEEFVEALPFGLMFGLLFGLILASSLKGETATLEVEDKRDFISQMNKAMWRLGYKPATRTEDLFTYRPSFELGTSGWRMSVEFVDGRAEIYGPKQYVKKLTKALGEA